MTIFDVASVIAAEQPVGISFSADVIGVLFQAGVTLVSVGVAYGLLRAGMSLHGKRLDKLEDSVDKMQSVMVLLARQEERYNAMDARVLAQGERQDANQTNMTQLINSTATILNGRLEAINQIVQGHTSQLAAMSMLGQPRLPPRREPSGGGA